MQIESLCTKKYKNIARKIAHGNPLWEDLYQESLIYVMKIPDEKAKTIRCLPCYFIKILSWQWNSTSSSFYWQYKKNTTLPYADIKDTNYFESEEDAVEIDSMEVKKIDTIKKTKEAAYWYDRMVFDLYMREGAIRKVQKITGIARTSLWETVNKMKKKIHENTFGRK